MMQYAITIAAFLSGAVLAHISKNTAQIKRIVNNYLIWFGLPFLIFLTLVTSGDIPLLKIFLFSITIMAVIIVSYYLLIRHRPEEKKTKASMLLCSAFGNWGYIGMPAGFLLFGDKGLITAAIMSFGSALVHFSLGIILSSHLVNPDYKHDLVSAFRFPFIYTMLAAFMISGFVSFEVPAFVSAFSRTAVYLAAFIIGLTLRLGKDKRPFYYTLFLKFILSPLIFSIVLLLFGFPKADFLLFLLLDRKSVV